MTDDGALFSRSGQSNGAGKLTEEVRSLLPPEVKEQLTALAVLSGRTLSEYLRDLLTDHVYGHVHRLRLQHGAQNRSAGIPQE